MKSTRSHGIVAASLLLATSSLLLFAQQDASLPEETAPARSDCTFNAVAQKDARAIWREVSMRAEAASPSRRRGAQPGGPTVPVIPKRNFIDDEVFGKMERDGVKPTVLASDEEFLRRITLDLTGAIPDTATVQSFLADTRADKRDRMIDQLLASDAFNDRWTLWFGDLVQNVQAATNTRLYYQGRNAYYTFIRNSIRDRKPYDRLVRELIAGSGNNFTSGPANFIVRQLQPNGPPQDTYDNLAASSAEKFLAQPLLCLSCHDGKYHLEVVNSYLATRTRRDFWKAAAFFARTQARPVRDPANPNIRSFDVTNVEGRFYQLNTVSGNKSPRQPREGESVNVEPGFFFGGATPAPGENWREAYGRMLTADPQFARATVNYLWKELFGLGIVEPADSFDLARLDPNTLAKDATLQPTHPRLLDTLAAEFRASGYDLRSILRTMAISSAYQLSARYTPGEWNESWAPYFARHLSRRLPAEMMIDAIFKATSVSPRMNVQGLPAVTRALQLPDPTEPGLRDPNARFMFAFGRGDRDDTPRSSDSSITQALALMNDPVVTTRVRASTINSTTQKTLAASRVPSEIAETIYLATLSRKPTADETAAAVTHLTSGDLTQKTEDLQYALINRLEFMFY